MHHFRSQAVRLFRVWHEGDPTREVSVNTNWAERYGYMGVMRNIEYHSWKWVQSGDVPADYHHPFEGKPCTVWGAHHEPLTNRFLNRRMPEDMPALGYVLLLEWEDEEGNAREVRFRRGSCWLAAPDARSLAIVDSDETHVPLILTGTRVLNDGITDR